MQARYLTELLDDFAAEQVDGAFAFTFIMPKYSHRADARYDLDMASFALVKSYPHRNGTTYPDLPWDPKRSFAALSDCYARL